MFGASASGKTHIVSPCENSSGRPLSANRYSLNHQMRNRMSVGVPDAGLGAVGGAGEARTAGS